MISVRRLYNYFTFRILSAVSRQVRSPHCLHSHTWSRQTLRTTKMPPAKRGKLTHNEGAQYHAARLRKDLSVIFELPTVPLDVVPAEQPAAFRGSLYMYQRRSLARMLEIEQGTQFSVQIGMSTQSFSPKGGVVADSALLATTLESVALTRCSAQRSASAPRCSASALLMLCPPACAAQRWAWARRPS